MKPISHVKLQSLEYHLGNYLAIRYCAPLAFYMLLRAAGWLDKELMPGPFCQELKREDLSTTNEDWSRPALTRTMRKKYSAPIISWVINGQEIFGEINKERMKQSGYIETKDEEKFFDSEVAGKSLEQIVRSGYPVIVTMQPGFGGSGSEHVHAVIIAGWEDDEVRVYDPDARNERTKFKPEEILKSLQHDGAGTIILPKTD